MCGGVFLVWRVGALGFLEPRNGQNLRKKGALRLVETLSAESALVMVSEVGVWRSNAEGGPVGEVAGFRGSGFRLSLTGGGSFGDALGAGRLRSLSLPELGGRASSPVCGERAGYGFGVGVVKV